MIRWMVVPGTTFGEKQLDPLRAEFTPHGSDGPLHQRPITANLTL